MRSHPRAAGSGQPYWAGNPRLSSTGNPLGTCWAVNRLRLRAAGSVSAFMDSVTSSTTWGGNTVAGTENLGAAPPELPLGDRVQFLVQGREQRRSRRWITGFRGADQLADRGAGSRHGGPGGSQNGGQSQHTVHPCHRQNRSENLLRGGVPDPSPGLAVVLSGSGQRRSPTNCISRRIHCNR